MIHHNLKEKLIRYIDAGFPIIYINSFEENKIDEIIQSAACGRKILEWNGFNGFVDFKTKSTFIADYSLKDTLTLLKTEGELDRKLLILKDMHSFMEDANIIAQIKGIVGNINAGLDTNIIMISSVLSIPRELEKYITVLDMDYLSTNEVEKIIQAFINDNSLQNINLNFLEEMSVAFKGLSEFEINNILALAYADDGELTRKDLILVFDQKQQMIKKSGILEMIPLKESMDDVGGLENLKVWLTRKARIFKNIGKAQAFGVDMPKGVLIAGMPGCGKSLNAKAAAKLFEVPLLRLDMGRLLGKYVGESEGNMRKAIALAEAISLCVLWIDELEKAFAGVGGDGGGAEVTTRLFGNFLTWMQEKDSPAFVVATANDITKLPPELFRKGRFDEIFYVGLPNDEERKKIFEIHIGKRRKVDLSKINIGELVAKTKGYSGADIEGVIKESIETVFSDGKLKLTTNDILISIKSTHSLSEIMKEPLEKMSKEYENRKLKNASK
ncbi:AAA family ATPase [Clostridium sp.]|uniref:AAA family ATPase n=1 Tax=Clostridium sp. TaxID=1506 RepID=UPI003D6CCFDE